MEDEKAFYIGLCHGEAREDSRWFQFVREVLNELDISEQDWLRGFNLLWKRSFSAGVGGDPETDAARGQALFAALWGGLHPLGLFLWLERSGANFSLDQVSYLINDSTRDKDLLPCSTGVCLNSHCSCGASTDDSCGGYCSTCTAKIPHSLWS